MDLTYLQYVDYQNPKAVREFVDMESLEHETIFNTILGLSIVIPHYPLWSDRGMDQTWVKVHNEMHDAAAGALGLSAPVNLDQIDWNDQDSVEDWFNNHYNAHVQLNEALGL